MAKYYEQCTLEKLLTVYCKYVPVNKKTLCQLFHVEEDKLNEAFTNVDLHAFDDKQLHTLEGVIFNQLNRETFDKKVPFDEHEYCWNMGLELLRRCELELKSRHPEEEIEPKGIARTSKKD
jgi:hypothetical protein